MRTVQAQAGAWRPAGFSSPLFGGMAAAVVAAAAALGPAQASAQKPLPGWPVTAKPAHAARPDDAAWAKLASGGVVLFRHANAPGVGDPPAFKLGDCATQRNLDERGRAQAQRIGEAFRERNIRVGAVLTSQWCRTRDTATLAFPSAGLVRDDADFNSFFGDGSGDSEKRQSAAARKTLQQWKGPGALVIVTHQVNITALTGKVPASGEGVIVEPKGDASLDIVGTVAP